MFFNINDYFRMCGADGAYEMQRNEMPDVHAGGGMVVLFLSCGYVVHAFDNIALLVVFCFVALYLYGPMLGARQVFAVVPTLHKRMD